MSKKILIVDDDPNICEVLKLYLQREGYHLLFASDGSMAIDTFRQHKPDLVILDIMLPIINGWEVCKLIRLDSAVPIIMLTAKDATEDKITGLDMGADDYVVKPFDPKEVVARVKAMLRRAGEGKEKEKEKEAPSKVITLGDLQVNLATYQVHLHNQPVDLKPKEIQLLFFLMQNSNLVFTREQLLERVWGYDYAGETRTVDVHIKRLREKLERPEGVWELKTVWGVGYKLEVK